LATLFATLFTNKAYSQSVEREKLIVSYTYNFAKNIQWPSEEKLSVFKIALFEVEQSTLVSEFEMLNDGVDIKNIPIQVTRTNNIQSLDNYNLIYIGTSSDNTVTQIQSLIQGKPILTVTSNYSNKRLVMINLFETLDKELQFEVNKANLINNNLTPLPELILLGGTEIDVARLYREGQVSLIGLQQQVSSQQRINRKLLNDMQTLNSDIKTMEATNNALTIELEQLNTTIEESKRLIAKQNDEIDQQQKQITNSQEQRQQLIRQVAQRNQELDQQQKQLLGKQKELDNISTTIITKEAQLSTLNQTISDQKVQIKQQESSIDELDKLVSAQKLSLILSWVLAICITMLLFLATYAYRMYRQDNKRLSGQTQDLQIARDKLDLARRKAESSNRAKSAFLSLMSHELRTPLQSIIGYTDIIIEELKMEGNLYYADQLIRVNTNGERLLELINNTLNLAKIEAGKMTVELTMTYISSLIEEAIDNIKPLMTKNKNVLNVNIDNEKFAPEVDYEKMLHILVNLLSNANKFTKQGTITITVNNHPEKLKIIVSDTGIGLTKEQETSIFKSFQQLSSGKTQKAQGTGLGLSITQHFCEIMGGSIEAKGKPDAGSDFIIEIPLPVVITEKTFIGIDDLDEFGEPTKIKETAA
ncbi:MAG: YfiR/HmsC family protein, partial [Pseudomonadota bacterium]